MVCGVRFEVLGRKDKSKKTKMEKTKDKSEKTNGG